MSEQDLIEKLKYTRKQAMHSPRDSAEHSEWVRIIRYLENLLKITPAVTEVDAFDLDWSFTG